MHYFVNQIMKKKSDFRCVNVKHLNKNSKMNEYMDAYSWIKQVHNDINVDFR